MFPVCMASNDMVLSDARPFPQDNITNIVNVLDDLSQWVSFDEFNEGVPHCDLYEECITANVPYPRETDVAPNVEDSEDEILAKDQDLLQEVSKMFDETNKETRKRIDARFDARFDEANKIGRASCRERV